MCKRHPHADVIIAWAEGKTVQQFSNEGWYDVTSKCPMFAHYLNYRIKPEPVEVITCNGVEITPMKEKPAYGATYFVADPTVGFLCQGYKWCNDCSDQRFFERGLVHRTAESAVAHSKAMLNNKKEMFHV